MAPLVLHVVHELAPGGLEAMAIGLVAALDPLRYRGAIACLRAVGVLAPRAHALGVAVYSLAAPPGVRPGLALTLGRLARRLGASLLHSHNTGALLYAAPAAAMSGLPLIHTEHGRELPTPAPSAAVRTRRRALAAAERLALACATRLAAVAPPVAQVLAPFGRKRPVVVVPNGVSMPELDGIARAAAREALGLPANAVVVGTVGRLEPTKGPDVLLEAARHVLPPRPHVRLLFIGDGTLRETLESRVRTLGLAGRIRFAGFRSDGPRLVAGLDVVVLPSRSEGVPLALLEAMAAGRPVVATAVGGNPFALGDAGLLVPPDAPKPLAAAIARVLDDPALAAALGARARARAEARFSERAMAAAYMALYDEALDRVHGATGTGR